MLNKLIIICILFILYELIDNIIKMFKCSYLINKINDVENKKKDIDSLAQYRQMFLKLTWFVVDKSFVKTYQSDDGMLVTQKTSTHIEFPFFSTLIPAKRMLLEAKGHYKANSLNVLNPIFLINKVIYLPANIFKYLGLDSKSFFSKFANLIWWILGVVFWFFTPIAEEYRSQFLIWIQNIFK
ncbi:MAG: hypothetical protein ACLSIL_12770 [Enterococcus casseliflavus]